MPDFVFNCVELLGLNQRCEFWGDAINYRNVQDYSARARFTTRTETATPLWSGINTLMPFVTGDYFPFIFNGVTLGTGKITSFSSEGGNDIYNKFFDINFQVLRSGDLSFVTGPLFTGYTAAGAATTTAFFPYLNSFSETFEYNQDHNKTVNFNRNLALDFERGFTNPYSGALGLKNTVLAALANFGIYHPLQPNQFWTGQGIKRNSSTWDQINNRYSFDEAYSYQSGMNWNWEYSHSLSFGADGVSSLSENGTILATRMGTNKIDYARTGWASIKTGIFARVSGVYAKWSGVFGSSCGFTDDPDEKSLVINPYVGSLEYNYSYSNSPGNHSGYLWEYQTSILQEQGEWATANENGTLKAKKAQTGQISLLVSAFSGVETGIAGRVQALYDSTVTFLKSPVCSTGYEGTLVATADERSFTDQPAEITYNYSYSDDPSYIATGLFRQVKASYSDTKPVHLVNTFNIVNDEEVAQGSRQSTLGVLSNRIDIIGGTGISIAQYYDRAVEAIRLPTDNTGITFISDEQYSYDPFSYAFSLSRDYTYSKYRAMNDTEI